MIKVRIGLHGITAKHWRKQIQGFKERENDARIVDVEKAKAAWIETQQLVDKVEKVVESLQALLDHLKNWNTLKSCTLGHILHSPPITFGVGKQCFMADWGIFEVYCMKLGDSFQGNKIDLDTF